MNIKILASGSRGNSTIIKTDQTTIMIDCGISYRQILQKQDIVRKTDFKLDALFITHEHFDHVSGLNTLLGNHEADIFLSRGTFDGIVQKGNERLEKSRHYIIKELDEITINDLTITPFNTSHDALEPFGYIISSSDKKLVYITDTGYLNNLYFPLLKNADIYILESNHDIEMLLESDRPFNLKERIFSDLGHLSNEDSAFNFYNLRGEKTKKLVLAHLSEECNTPDKALMTYFDTFNNLNSQLDEIEILIAKQHFVVEVKI